MLSATPSAAHIMWHSMMRVFLWSFWRSPPFVRRKLSLLLLPLVLGRRWCWCSPSGLNAARLLAQVRAASLDVCRLAG